MILPGRCAPGRALELSGLLSATGVSLGLMGLPRLQSGAGSEAEGCGGAFVANPARCGPAALRLAPAGACIDSPGPLAVAHDLVLSEVGEGGLGLRATSVSPS